MFGKKKVLTNSQIKYECLVNHWHSDEMYDFIVTNYPHINPSKIDSEAMKKVEPLQINITLCINAL
jgi:hypothetical protein